MAVTYGANALTTRPKAEVRNDGTFDTNHSKIAGSFRLKERKEKKIGERTGGDCLLIEQSP